MPDPRAPAAPHPIRPIRSPPAEGALVGTSSVRRQAQLLHARPDLRVAPIRGNVQTRLAQAARRRMRRQPAGAGRPAPAGSGCAECDRAGARKSWCRPPRQGIVGITVARRRHELLELLAGDRGSRSARRRPPRSGPCWRSWTALPHADRRLCAGAARSAADADRHGGSGGWFVHGDPSLTGRLSDAATRMDRRLAPVCGLDSPMDIFD